MGSVPCKTRLIFPRLNSPIVLYYSTSLKEVKIARKTSTNISRYLYSRRPVWPVFIYKRCMAENISFSEENNGKKPNCKLKYWKPSFYSKFAWSTIRCRHLLYIDRICKLYKVKIQQGRRKQTLSCAIEMVLAKTRERNNVHLIQSPPRKWTVFTYGSSKLWRNSTW